VFSIAQIDQNTNQGTVFHQHLQPYGLHLAMPVFGLAKTKQRLFDFQDFPRLFWVRTSWKIE